MLAQEFDEATFRKGFDGNLENAHDIRMAVRQAKKYVLDHHASRQLIDIGNPIHWEDTNLLRHLARSPHEKMWVEFNNRARRERLFELATSETMAGPAEVIPRMAWLIESHKDQPSSHRATLIISTDVRSVPNDVEKFFSEIEQKVLHGNQGIYVMPFSWQWDTEDTATSPWGYSAIASMNSKALARRDFSDIKLRLDIAELALGRLGLVDKFVGVTKGYGTSIKVGKFYNDLAGEFAGEVRYMMAFIASLNSTKMIAKSNVSVPEGRHPGGRTLPAYEYTEVRITIPKRRKLAKYLEATSTHIKMRNHDVGGFWRIFERGTQGCVDRFHTWELGSVPGRQNCTHCGAWRTWVKEHQRGDPALGRVEHVKRVVT